MYEIFMKTTENITSLSFPIFTMIYEMDNTSTHINIMIMIS